eukprot:TRINITY_DN11_c2_g1_i2.p1 TRINITY_DN11_c2_g1~~TRINITY_DN11_c2_g1_i2.p1  ORF type:complete len:409 (+),score=59.30 TRINITY_DN11_c2_g1_i2:377-1603(+)
MKLLVHGIASPVLAAVADAVGRKPVLMLGLFGFAVAFSLMSVVALLPAMHQTTSIVSFGFFLQGALGAFEVTLLSMLADMTPDSDSRSSAFSAYFAVSALSEASAQLAAVAILRQRLTSYVFTWFLLAVSFVLQLMRVSFKVQETLVRSGLEMSPGSSWFAPFVFKTSVTSSAKAIASASNLTLRLLAENPFFRVWLCTCWLYAFSSGLSSIEASFTLVAYEWGPGDLQACLWPSRILQFMSLTVLSPLVTRYQPVRVAACVTVVGCIASLLSVFAPFAPTALVLSNLMYSSLAFGRPVTEAFLSSLFSAGNQAKMQALTHLCNNVGSSMSMAMFSSPLIFRPEVRGWAASRPFAIAALMQWVGGALRLAVFVSVMLGLKGSSTRGFLFRFLPEVHTHSDIREAPREV